VDVTILSNPTITSVYNSSLTDGSGAPIVVRSVEFQSEIDAMSAEERVVFQSEDSNFETPDEIVVLNRSSMMMDNPCHCAHRWRDGAHWNTNGTINDNSNAPQSLGLVRCGSSARSSSAPS
jgi:hypothetical protein